MPRASLPPFLEKLQRITETVEADVASWSEDGKTYVIHKAKEFETVLKQHFKGNVQTFIRQLHFYGFRKLDTQSDGWSFVHKNFMKGKPELLYEIRRKTRSDPTAESAASQGEVLALRSRVAFLQDVVEDLRTQIDSVVNVLDEAGLAEVERRLHDRKAVCIKAGNKRQRAENNGLFVKTCENIRPVLIYDHSTDFAIDSTIDDADIESASLGGLSLSDMSNIDEVLILHEDDDLMKGSLLWEDSFEEEENDDETTDVIKSISRATKLDQESVSRVVDYFKKLSTEDQTFKRGSLPLSCGKSELLSKSLDDLSHLSYQELTDSLMTHNNPEYLPRLQKVR